MEDTKQNLVSVSKSGSSTRPGQQARKERRDRIHLLTSVIVGNYGWRKAFAERYPQFDTPEGAYALNRATSGRTDDQMVLNAFEDFIPYVVSTQPEWWVKRPNPLPQL